MELLTPLFRQSALSDCFSAEATLQGMLSFEAALAKVQSRLGIVPPSAAAAIENCCRSEVFDHQRLALAAASAGNLAIPLVKMLTEQVQTKDAEAARYVHWGATSQDAMDSGLMLQLRQAFAHTETLLVRLIAALAAQCVLHQQTAMVGRTWMQHALPTTLGLKLAGTLDALQRYRQRLREMRSRVLVLQLGGAAGTLASLGARGPEVISQLAKELGLAVPDTPWHGQRDRLLEIAGWYAGLTGSLGKLARDVSLLMQTEVGELSEPTAEGRGGSSTMPHKRNPVSCAVILAAAARVPALVAGLYAGMVQEHERGLGGWHAEWESLPELLMLSGGALAASVTLVEGLQAYPERMRQNLQLTGGLIMAESVALALAESVGRAAAHQHIEHQCRQALASGCSLLEVLSNDDYVRAHLSLAQLAVLLDPLHATGLSSHFIQQVLSRAEA